MEVLSYLPEDEIQRGYDSDFQQRDRQKPQQHHQHIVSLPRLGKEEADEDEAEHTNQHQCPCRVQKDEPAGPYEHPHDEHEEHGQHDVLHDALLPLGLHNFLPSLPHRYWYRWRGEVLHVAHLLVEYGPPFDRDFFIRQRLCQPGFYLLLKLFGKFRVPGEVRHLQAGEQGQYVGQDDEGRDVAFIGLEIGCGARPAAI